MPVCPSLTSARLMTATTHPPTCQITSIQRAVKMLPLPPLPSAIFAEAVQLAHEDEEREGGRAQRRSSRFSPRGRRHRHHITRGSGRLLNCWMCVW